MKKLFTVVFLAALSVFTYAQDFSAMSLASDQKIEIGTKEISKEINLFNVSMEDGVVVHNRIKTNGETESQIYKMTGYKDFEAEGMFGITIFFKSKVHSYELEIIESEDGVFIVGENFMYRAKVYSLKTYK